MFLTIFILTVVQVDAADSIVLSKPPVLRKNVAAMPLIRNPESEEHQRINLSLKKIDATMLSTLAECDRDYSNFAQMTDNQHAEQSHRGDWTRKVAVTMAGPRYLSYLIKDSNFCGGAHPNFSESALVFDLKTGSPVNWTAVLGRESKLQPADDWISIPAQQVVNKSLKAFYAEHLSDDECRKIVSEDDDLSLLIWPDAKLRKLVLGSNLRHVVEACAEHVTLSAEEARQLGFSDTFLQTIEVMSKH
jgi:hypothetical protein